MYIPCLISLPLLPLTFHYHSLSSVNITLLFPYEHLSRLANEVTSILRREKIDFWLDYATLLGYLRNDPINVWDHDTDFSILRKDEGVIPRLLQLFNTPGPYGMHAEYEGVRSLIQVCSTSLIYYPFYFTDILCTLFQ